MQLAQYLKLINYELGSTSKYLWKAFGPNAFYFDYHKTHKHSEISVVADIATQRVYKAMVIDSVRNKQYMWIDPEFRDDYKYESESRNCNPLQAYDAVNYVELETENDWLEKARAIYLGEPYDERVVIPLDLPDDLLLSSMMRAHELDITFNEYVERCIKTFIADDAQKSA
jgi:hypothetical protein